MNDVCLETEDAKTDADIQVVTEGRQIGRTRGRQENNITAGANIVANNSATITTIKEEFGTVNVSEKGEDASVSEQSQEPEPESVSNNLDFKIFQHAFCIINIFV